MLTRRFIYAKEKKTMNKNSHKLLSESFVLSIGRHFGRYPPESIWKNNNFNKTKWRNHVF